MTQAHQPFAGLMIPVGVEIAPKIVFFRYLNGDLAV
jgi:hypothetical protein